MAEVRRSQDRESQHDEEDEDRKGEDEDTDSDHHWQDETNLERCVLPPICGL